MTQQIRKNVFETNSSSSHSLTLAAGDLVKTPFNLDVLRLGTLRLGLGEYNWEWYRYYDTDNKAQYLMTQLFHYNGIPNGDAAEVTRELRNDARFDMLCRVIEDQTGVKLEAIPGSQGGIDHDSHGNCLEVFESEDKLRTFLFSDSSYIETGNDNSGPFKTIESDRGTLEYYSASYREPGKDDVAVKLRTRNHWDFEELATLAGAKLDESNNPELFKALQEQATFTASFVDSKDSYHPFEYGEPEGDTMSHLVSAGLKFSANLAVSVEFTKLGFREEGRYTHTTLTAYVPKELAAQLDTLQPTEEPATTEE